MIELDGQKISMKELIERCFKDDRLPLDIIRDGKPMKVEMVMKPSPSRDLLMAEYDKMPRYVVFGGLVFQPIQRNVLAAADISMRPSQRSKLCWTLHWTSVITRKTAAAWTMKTW